MKHTKKLIPAIGMLLLSACMLVTSTFAWFSMNTDVTVTNMKITAVGDQVYLQIVKADAGFVAGNAQTSVKAEDNPTKYAPTNVYGSFDETTPGKYDGKATSLVWVAATSKDPAVSDKATKYTNVTSSVGTYAYHTQYDLRLDPNAGSVDGGKLKVTSVAFDSETVPQEKLANCVSVLIVCKSENMSILYKQASQDTTAKEFTAVDGSSKSLTAAGFPHYEDESDIITVDIYVFFDGDNKNCTTANVVDNTYAVSVAFNVAADGVQGS